MNDADEGDTMPSEWLTLADRPFHPTSEARRPVSIEWARQSGHAAHLYLLGYRRAAELLLPELITRSNEQLVFPFLFLFLWRHHIELYLKFLLELARESQGQTGKTAKVHTLPQLWHSLRPLLEPDMLDTDLNAVQQIVMDLHNVDPRATDARYAEGETSTGLVESLAKVPDGFNPEHFAAVLTKVSDLFDGMQTEYTNRRQRIEGPPCVFRRDPISVPTTFDQRSESIRSGFRSIRSAFRSSDHGRPSG